MTTETKYKLSLIIGDIRTKISELESDIIAGEDDISDAESAIIYDVKENIETEIGRLAGIN